MASARKQALFNPPHQAPDYASAAALGQLPAVPTSPPPLIPGRSARKEFHRFLLRMGLAVAPLVVGPELLDALGLPLLLGAAYGLVVLLLGAHWWAQLGDRMLAELRAGYITFDLEYGLVGRGGHAYWHATAWGVPWDHRGVWLLREDGSVIRPPDTSVAPPGMYPSPSRPQTQELWTGAAWTGQYASR